MIWFFLFAAYAFLSCIALIWQEGVIRQRENKIAELEAINFDLRVELQKTKLYVAREYKDAY